MAKLLPETQLERLRDLEARKKAGEKLNGDERLMLQRLRAEKMAAEAAARLARIDGAEKRRLDRRSYQIGRLALAAGLENSPDDHLRWGFARLAEVLKQSGNASGSRPVVPPAVPHENGTGSGGSSNPANAVTSMSAAREITDASESDTGQGSTGR